MLGTFMGLLITVMVLTILVALWICYFKSKKTLFEIDYAGGKIAFDVSLYSKAEMDDFQRKLRLAKDMALENGINVIKNSNSTSIIDELEKYSDLMQKGIISQQEFDDLKKKAISK